MKKGNKENVLISACLLGVACRYDGKSVKKFDPTPFLDSYNFIPVCPEIYGGLETPRTPSERVEERVVMKNGKDVTEQFFKGANEALLLCKIFDCKFAVLKEKSPSCGSGLIYDGSFSGRLTKGDGVTAELLKANGITVIGESEAERLLEH